MSSTKRGAVRAPHDFYETPAGAAAPVMRELRAMFGNYYALIVDAGAGLGALTRAAAAEFEAGMVEAVEAFPQDLPLERAAPAGEEHAAAEWRRRGADPYEARLRAAGAVAVTVADFMTLERQVDVVVSNPPFALAMDFLRHTIEDIDPPLAAFLLRLNFLGSAKRADWLAAHPPRAIRVLTKRPNFTGQGTDSIEYAWMLWGRGVPPGTAPIGWYR